jgi:hypothetical protein
MGSGFTFIAASGPEGAVDVSLLPFWPSRLLSADAAIILIMDSGSVLA